jgi:MFS family permease
LIADWYPPVQRGRATTAVAIGAVLGVSSSYALAGPLLNAFGSQADGWRWTMLGLTIPLLVVLVLLLALRDPPSPDGARHAVSSRGEYGQLWEHRSLVLPLVCGYALIGGIADGALLVWAGPVLMRSFAATPVSVGNIMATALLINGVAAPIIGGALADFGQRTGGPPRTVMLLIGLLSVSVPLSLFALSPGILTASALLTLFFICGTSFQVSLMTLTTIVIPSHLRASCIAFLLALSNSFGYGVAPFLVSQLSTRLGGTDRVDISLSIVCFTSSVLGALAFWWTSRSWPSALAGGPARTRSLQHGTAL